MTEPQWTNELGDDVSEHNGEPYVGPYEVGYKADGMPMSVVEWQRRKDGEIPWD